MNLNSEFVIILVKILLDASKRDPLQTFLSRKGEYISREREREKDVFWTPGLASTRNWEGVWC